MVDKSFVQYFASGIAAAPSDSFGDETIETEEESLEEAPQRIKAGHPRRRVNSDTHQGLRIRRAVRR